MSLIDTVLGWFGLARVRPGAAPPTVRGRQELTDAAGFQLPVHGAARIEPEPPPDLSEDQQGVLDAILSEDDAPQVALILGAAGTGKSTVIEALRERLAGQVIVAAFTGVASHRIHGTTIHRLFSFGPHALPFGQTNLIPTLPPDRLKVIQEAKFLVIDEVSMVRCDLLDAMDASLRKNLGRPDVPFGGKRIVMVGDVRQLSPVVSSDEQNLIFDGWEGEFFFHAHVWRELRVSAFELKQVHRTATDPAFGKCLLALRDPATLPDAVEALSDLVSRNSEDERSVILATTNAVADGVNTTRLQALAGQVRVFNGQVSGDYANSELPVPRTIRLKVGARVMVAANDRAEPRRYVNGTMGTIRVIHDGQVQLERDDGVDVWIEPYVWQRIEPQWHDERKEIVMVPVATYTQIPLKLGWAFTVHKAQGLTFDRVHIKPGNGFFCSGHAYVAVTRCRTSAGLSCDRPFTVGDFHWDEDVRGFLARLGP